MSKKKSKTIQKSITIREDQEEYIKDIHLNLSRFVQEKLDEHKKEHTTDAENQDE
jgi:post-segregation antitoxin (ccd killing protein)